MNSFRIIMVTIMIVLIIIVLVAAGYLIYLELIVNNPTRKYQQLRTGDNIRLGFFINNKFYSLSAMVNDNNNCDSKYLALVPGANLANQNSVFNVYVNSSNKNQFALRTLNNTFCYLIDDKTIGQYIAFGSSDNRDPTIWFSLSEDGILYSYKEDRLGLLPLTNADYMSCYRGELINNQPQLFGVSGNSQNVILQNLTYPFATGDKITISSNEYQLMIDCRENNLVSFSNLSKNPDPFVVTLSGDKLAFSFVIPLGDSQAFMGATTMNGITYLNILNSLSDYDSGNYTTWFTLNNQGTRLISLLTNTELSLDTKTIYPCTNVSSYLTTFELSGSDINIDIVK